MHPCTHVHVRLEHLCLAVRHSEVERTCAHVLMCACEHLGLAVRHGEVER